VFYAFFCGKLIVEERRFGFTAKERKEGRDGVMKNCWLATMTVIKIPKWVEWWIANGKDFKVTKTIREALDERKKDRT